MKTCQTCGKEYGGWAQKYCSRECYASSMVGHESRNTGRTHFKKGMTPWNKGKPWTENVLAKIRLTKRIRPPHKVVLPTYNQQKGSAHWNWRGGITSTNEAVRKSRTLATWRKNVFLRDDYTCQACGKRGGVLHADHELPFSLFPALRFEVLNGRTLCEPCHRATDTFGPKLRWLSPLERYLAPDCYRTSD